MTNSDPVAADRPENLGPFDAVVNGACACHGEPVNGYGRCQSLITQEASSGQTS